MRFTWLVSLVLVAFARLEGTSGFVTALHNAEVALEQKDLENARRWLERALERDPKSVQAWDLRARLAESGNDRDEQIWSLHRELRLLVAQKAPRQEQDALRARLVALDPLATDVLDLSKVFIAKLQPIAAQYEKDKRPHSAIRVHKAILALGPELEASRIAIERLAAAPDPSLAEDAKPKDLLADVSKEWIREHDEKHGTWDTRSELVRTNYTTKTDAGYECMVRAGEAMEQMNAFYRVFFQFGTEKDKKNPSRIDLVIFKNRDEYLKLGSGPPVDWSGGQFTGDAVETYVGAGGFQEVVGTLFHEAAHQFVSLATNSAGWLNEGLASFFEGCRILQNGTVLMNEPADHRLFPLVDRMKNGWMSSAADGIDPKKPDSEPKTAPSFRIVLENEYDWGPPWYAPTWGVVYFLYNYQDPVDGRYVYRAAFREFIDASGGKTGKSAIVTFEEVVLAKPKPPIKGVKRPDGSKDVSLPKTVDELNEVWKKWLVDLSEERSGKLELKRPYLDWARAAIQDKDPVIAEEHFEKGVVATPNDVALLSEFAAFLAERKNTDRATKLMLRALQVLEAAPKPDAKAIADAERLLDKWDPKRSSLEHVHVELAAAAKNIVARYEAEQLPMMVMDVAWRLGTQHDIPELFDAYRRALEHAPRTLQLWELAYNEQSLAGWSAVTDAGFRADGPELVGKMGTYAPDKFDFQILTLDRVTGGDFSMEAEVKAERGKVNFCGLVFGRKGTSNFHALILFPGHETTKEGTAGTGFVDLATSYGAGTFKTWRHTPVTTSVAKGETATARWFKLRIDVAGSRVDTWFDGEFLSTQEFPSLDVLRGNFGLIVGPGETRYRNVRFLARDPRDPASAIERDVRMAELEKSGKAINGSYLNKVPPFPKIKKWAGAERKTWEDAGPVPQLFVLWSVDQNEIVPIDAWLRDLAARTKDVGLQIVSVTSPDDEPKLDAYLKAHPFPGAVGVDFRAPGAFGVGETNDLYFTTRFNLPRLLLLDIDQRVAWEGDPGFAIAEPYRPGLASFLETPLEELLTRRKMKEFLAWRGELPKLAPALHEGRFADAVPILKAAEAFDPKGAPEVADALKSLVQVTSTLEAATVTIGAFQREEAEAAFALLVEWNTLLGKTLDKKGLADCKAALEAKSAKAWATVPGAIESYRKKFKKSGDPATTAEFVAKLEAMPGRFARELVADLKAAQAKDDAATFERLLDEAPRRPLLWLARDYFLW
ncbi:MAG: hypothetical protein K8S98_14490 [Planctomycetes bacterium]|nr:hypothetical protein [Planctomycetota bacterium]